jgi:5S rRNA maturation endonuclease (ribonuclease M5)
MDTRKMNIATAKQIDLIEFLEKLGYRAKKISGNDHWYLSPLRIESTPSFKVNSKEQVWYDFGIGKGGNIVDFGILLYNCSVAEFLEKLSIQGFYNTFSFQQQKERTVQPAAINKSKITINEIREIQSPELKAYLSSRCIALESATALLKEVSYSVNGKEWLALGLQNNAGGYELRGLQTFKSSISPKDFIHIDIGTGTLAIVEGMFDYLSHAELNQPIVPDKTDWLILNSLSFIDRARPIMGKYEKVYLLLDNDEVGKMAAKNLINLSPKFHDLSHHYKGSKDLNEHLVKQRSNTLSVSITQKPERIKRKIGF